MPTIFGSPLPPGKVGSTKGEIRIRVDKLLLDEDALLQFQEELNENGIQPRSVVSETPSPSHSRPTSSSSSRLPSKLASSSGAAGGGKNRSPNRFVIPVDHCAVAPLFFGEPLPSTYCIPATASETRGAFTLVYPIKEESEVFSEYLGHMTDSPHRGLQVQVFVPSSYSGRRAIPVGRAILDLKDLAPRKNISGWFTLGAAMPAKKGKIKEDTVKPLREMHRDKKMKTLPESTPSDAKHSEEQVPLNEKKEANEGERRKVGNIITDSTSLVIVPVGRVKLCLSLCYFSRPQVLDSHLSIEGTHLETPPRDRGTKDKSTVVRNPMEGMDTGDHREAGRKRGAERENEKTPSLPSASHPHALPDGGAVVPDSSIFTSKTSPTPPPTSSTALAAPSRAGRNEGEEVGQNGSGLGVPAVAPSSASSWKPAGVATVADLSRGENPVPSRMYVSAHGNPNGVQSSMDASSPPRDGLPSDEWNADGASLWNSNEVENTFQHGLGPLSTQQPSSTMHGSLTKEEVLEKVWQQGQQLKAKMREALQGANETVPPVPNAMSTLFFSSPSAGTDVKNGIMDHPSRYPTSYPGEREGQEMPPLQPTQKEAAGTDWPPSPSGAPSLGGTFAYRSLPTAERLPLETAENANTAESLARRGVYPGGIGYGGSRAQGMGENGFPDVLDAPAASSTVLFQDLLLRDAAAGGVEGVTDSASVTSTLYTSEDSDAEERFGAQLQRNLDDAAFRRGLGDSSVQYAESRRRDEERRWRESNGEGEVRNDGKRFFVSPSSPYGNRKKYTRLSNGLSPFRDTFPRHPKTMLTHVSLLFSRISFPHNPHTADVEEIRINGRLSQDISTAYPSPGPFSSLVHPLPLSLDHLICLRFDVSGFSENSKLVIEFYKVRSRPVAMPGARLLPSGVSPMASPSAATLPPSREVIGETLLGLCIVGLYQQDREIALENPLQNVVNAYAHFILALDPMPLSTNGAPAQNENEPQAVHAMGKRSEQRQSETERREGYAEEGTGEWPTSFSHSPQQRHASDQRVERELPLERETNPSPTSRSGCPQVLSLSPGKGAVGKIPTTHSDAANRRNDASVGDTSPPNAVGKESSRRGKEVSFSASPSPVSRTSDSSPPSNEDGVRAALPGTSDGPSQEEEAAGGHRRRSRRRGRKGGGRRSRSQSSSAAMADPSQRRPSEDEGATDGGPARHMERVVENGRGGTSPTPPWPTFRSEGAPAIASSPLSSVFPTHRAEEHTSVSAARLPSTAGADHFSTTKVSSPAAYLPSTRPAGRCRFHIAIMGARDIPHIGVLPKGLSTTATSQRDVSITQTSFCRPNIFFVIEEIFSGVDNDVASTGAVPDWLVEASTGGHFDRTEVVYDSTHPAFQYESIVSLPQESVWLLQSRKISPSTLRHAAAMMTTIERPFVIDKKKASRGGTRYGGGITDDPTAYPDASTGMKNKSGETVEKDPVAVFHMLSRHSKGGEANGAGTHCFPRPCLRELQITMWHAVHPDSPSYCPPLHEGQSEEEVFWSNAAYIGECRVDLRPLRYLPALQGYYRITATGHPPLLTPPKVPTLSSTCMGHVHLAISLLPSDE